VLGPEVRERRGKKTRHATTRGKKQASPGDKKKKKKGDDCKKKTQEKWGGVNQYPDKHIQNTTDSHRRGKTTPTPNEDRRDCEEKR